MNCIQVFGLGVVACLVRKRARRFLVAGGVTLALLVLFKPNLILVPVFLFANWLFRKDLKKTLWLGIGGMLGILLGVGISSSQFSATAWLKWASVQGELVTFASLDEGNVSLFEVGKALNSGLEIPIVLFQGFVVAGILLLFMKWSRATDYLVIGIGALAYIIVAPLVWLHYYIFLIPLMFAVFKWATESKRDYVIAVMLFAIMSSAPNLVLSFFLPAPTFVYVLQCFGSIFIFGFSIWKIGTSNFNLKKNR